MVMRNKSVINMYSRALTIVMMMFKIMAMIMILATFEVTLVIIILTSMIAVMTTIWIALIRAIEFHSNNDDDVSSDHNCE